MSVQLLLDNRVSGNTSEFCNHELRAILLLLFPCLEPMLHGTPL